MNLILPPLFAHQQETADFSSRVPKYLDISDPGTGKTRANLVTPLARQAAGGGKILVLAPKSILFPAWGNDIQKFFPGTSFSIATAANRRKAFGYPADVYITNHDAVNWLAKNTQVLADIDTMILDEFTAFKHRTSNRSRALKSLMRHFEYCALLSGTPNPNTILDIWHPMFLLDGGARLGTSFWKFRSQVCSPTQCGPDASMVKWTDNEGIEDVVALLLQDITIRHRFEDCVSMPPNTVHEVLIQLTTDHHRVYGQLRQSAILELEAGNITSLNQGALRTKLLQCASGAVYDNEHVARVIDTSRYELVIELIKERPWPCLCAFNWSHERDNLVLRAESEGLRYAVIDGTVTNQMRRNEIVADFQDRKLDVLFAHPRTAAHGLTLTSGRTTIWPSPPDNSEHFHQFNKRIPRAGQTATTETLLIAAEDTLDQAVYATLQGKLSRMQNLLQMLSTAA